MVYCTVLCYRNFGWAIENRSFPEHRSKPDAKSGGGSGECCSTVLYTTAARTVLHTVTQTPHEQFYNGGLLIHSRRLSQNALQTLQLQTPKRLVTHGKVTLEDLPTNKVRNRVEI